MVYIRSIPELGGSGLSGFLLLMIEILHCFLAFRGLGA